MNAIVQTQPQEKFSLQGAMMNPASLQAMQTFADAMSKAAITVPAHFRGKPGDCLAVVMQAAQWGMNPFAVAQKTHVVNGTLGYEAQLVNAVVQQSGAIEGAFSYEYSPDGDRCRVGAVIKGQREITWGEWLSASSVTTKNSPLWKTNPRQQMAYLQVKNWARLYAPGAILGVYSDDELSDQPAMRDMGMAQEVAAPTQRPPYPAEAFDANLPKWAAPIKAGKKTADQIIAMVETKGALSDDQKAAIRAIRPVETVDADTGEIVGAPGAPAAPSPREVDAALRAAQTLAELDAAAHGINTAPEQAQEALIETYNACRAEITGA